MRAMSNEVEQSQRYRAPSLFTEEGGVERRREREHVLAIRTLEREAREAVAAAAAQTVAAIADMTRREHVIENAKMKDAKAHDLSRRLAGDDPELQAKYAIYDTEFFQGNRMLATEPAKGSDRLF